jgi:hypothetical protein
VLFKKKIKEEEKSPVQLNWQISTTGFSEMCSKLSSAIS